MVAFDTHATVKRLTVAGFSEPQAEALSDAVHQAVTGGIATKTDLAGLETRMTRIEADLLWIKRIGGVIVALLAVPILRDFPVALGG